MLNWTLPCGAVSARLATAGRGSFPKNTLSCDEGPPTATASCIGPAPASLRGTVVQRDTNISTVTVGASVLRLCIAALDSSWLRSSCRPNLRSSEPVPCSHSSSCSLLFTTAHSSSMPRLADIVGPCCQDELAVPLLACIKGYGFVIARSLNR
jgi:hypothetical protein